MALYMELRPHLQNYLRMVSIYAMANFTLTIGTGPQKQDYDA